VSSDASPRDGTESRGVYWSAKIYDQKTNEFFKIRADENGIRVFPVDEDFSLSTFARFYEFVVENIDRRAEPVANPERGGCDA